MTLAATMSPGLEALLPMLQPTAEPLFDASLLPAELPGDDEVVGPDDFSALLALVVPPPAAPLPQVPPDTSPQPAGPDQISSAQRSQTGAVAPVRYERGVVPALPPMTCSVEPDPLTTAGDLRGQAPVAAVQPKPDQVGLVVPPANDVETANRGAQKTDSNAPQVKRPLLQVEPAIAPPAPPPAAVLAHGELASTRPAIKDEQAMVQQVLPSGQPVMPQQTTAAVTAPPATQQPAMPMVMRLDAPALPLPVIRRLTGLAPQPVQARLPRPVPAPAASAFEQTQLMTAAIQPADEAALVPASPQPVVVPASAPVVQAVTVPDKRMPESPATPAMSTPRLTELADTIVGHIAVAVAAPPAKAALTAPEPTEQATMHLARAAERAPMASTVEKASAITADVELSRREAAEPGPTNSAASPAPQVLSQTLQDGLPITPTAAPQFQQTVQGLPEREVSAAERVTAQPQATETPDEVVHQMRLTLSPPDLGAVTLRIETRGQEVSAHLLVDQLVAGHVLRQAETEVRQLLHNQGLQMGSYEVDYQHSQQHQPHQRPLPLALHGKAIAVPSRPQGRQPVQESAIDVFA